MSEFNLDAILEGASARRRDVDVCLNAGLINAHEEAMLALQSALNEAGEGDLSGGDSPEVIAAAERVKEVVEQIDEATHTFRLQAVSRKEWADLLAEFPPTREQQRAGHDADPDKFPVAAVAACLVEPRLSRAEVAKLASSGAVPFGEWQKLWLAALTLNVPPTNVPKLGAVSDLLRQSGRSSITPDPEASPDHGSLAGDGEQ